MDGISALSCGGTARGDALGSIERAFGAGQLARILARMYDALHWKPLLRKYVASYVDRATLVRSNGVVTVTASTARPLQQALTALREEYGWNVSYEDPYYMGTHDLEDISTPEWAAAHPNARAPQNIAGGLFVTSSAEFSAQKLASDVGMQEILSKVISDYKVTDTQGTLS